MISFPKNKIKVLLLENIHENAFNLFKDDGFQVEIKKDARVFNPFAGLASFGVSFSDDFFYFKISNK